MSDVKPDWSKAPEWANYWAVDAGGHSFWYSEKPHRKSNEWCLDGIVQYAGQFTLEKLPHTFNWFDSLHANPKNIVDVTVTLEKPMETVEINPFLSSDEDKEESVHKLYPKYYKDVSEVDSLDVYGVHKLFSVDDPSGAIQHASKKLLLSGVRTGGKSKWDDIREARDTLNRWLELNKED